MNQRSEHPIDTLISRFFEECGWKLRRSHDGCLVNCPACGLEVHDSCGRCQMCGAAVPQHPSRPWWEGDVEFGTTICSCCDERLATKMSKVRIVKVVGWCGGSISWYERYVQIPTCSKCNLRVKVPFLRKRILSQNLLFQYLFTHGCGLNVCNSPLP